MEGEEGGGIRLSKRFSDDNKGGGAEVDYKNKSGTAWSHSYLNQKPWHPLSYPNQRRKWIAEQTHANRQRRTEEVAREYAQEQEFYRQTNLISKKDKEKVELMQAVSFMYVRPPGYNPESAKAAEMNDQNKREEMTSETNADAPSSSLPPSSSQLNEEKKKPRPKDVFGRSLPTGEEFEVLKNAPKLETGVAGRAKPFGVEVRNVKCLRCGSYGHQSGDRECPLKDAIMPNEESRLKRDDPLNAILARTDPTETLKWELKQKPGISPPRGGFKPDDPNQQIVAADDIFDEYGGFLSMDNIIPDLLTNFSKKPKKSKKSKHKKQEPVHSESEASSDDGERKSKKKKIKVNKKKQHHAESSSSDTSVSEKNHGKSRHKSSYSSEDSDRNMKDRSKRTKHKHSFSPKGSDQPRHSRSKHGRRRHSSSSESSGSDGFHENYKNGDKHSYSSEDSDRDRDDRSRKDIQKHKSKHSNRKRDDSGAAGNHVYIKSRDEHSYSSEDDCNHKKPNVKRTHKHSSTAHCDSEKYCLDRWRGDQKSRGGNSYSSEDSDVDKNDQSRRIKQKHSTTSKGSEHPEHDMSKQSRKKHLYSSKDSGADRYHISEKNRYERSYSSDDSDHGGKHRKLRRSSHKH